MSGNPKHTHLHLMLWISFLLWVIPAPVFGGYITMETVVDTALTGDELRVAVKMTNKGDEPAFDVIVNAAVGGNSKTGQLKKKLGPGQSFKSTMDFKLFYSNPGKYPVIIRADFADANQYPFSSVSITHIVFKEAAYPLVSAKMAPVSMVKKGKARLKIKNLDETDSFITVKMVMPKEISVAYPVKAMTLPALMERELIFELANFSALTGARQPIFALISYDKNGKHHETLASANVTILEKRRLTKFELALILGIPIAALVIFSFYLLWRRRK